MALVDVINAENSVAGKKDLPDNIFNVAVNRGLLHEVIRNCHANKRQGSAATKTRGCVRGGGRKPYRQKGTGRSRAGSIRSPLWKGGGTIFGPQPRKYSYRVPKKVKWAALSSALSAKMADGEIIVIDNIDVGEPKTKTAKGMLNNLRLDRNVLIITPEKNEKLELAVRNLPRVDVVRVKELNVYSVISHEKLLISLDAIDKMQEAYLE